MWVAVTLAAVTLTGTGFMLWFLFALLRENTPSTCYWLVPIRREPGTERLKSAGASYADDDSVTGEPDAGKYSFEVLENERDAQECVPGLIALNLRFIHDRVGWRSIHGRSIRKTVDVFREYGL